MAVFFARVTRQLSSVNCHTQLFPIYSFILKLILLHYKAELSSEILHPEAFAIFWGS